MNDSNNNGLLNLGIESNEKWLRDKKMTERWERIIAYCKKTGMKMDNRWEIRDNFVSDVGYPPLGKDNLICTDREMGWCKQTALWVKKGQKQLMSEEDTLNKKKFPNEWNRWYNKKKQLQRTCPTAISPEFLTFTGFITIMGAMPENGVLTSHEKRRFCEEYPFCEENTKWGTMMEVNNQIHNKVMKLECAKTEPSKTETEKKVTFKNSLVTIHRETKTVSQWAVDDRCVMSRDPTITIGDIIKVFRDRFKRCNTPKDFENALRKSHMKKNMNKSKNSSSPDNKSKNKNDNIKFTCLYEIFKTWMTDKFFEKIYNKYQTDFHQATPFVTISLSSTGFMKLMKSHEEFRKFYISSTPEIMEYINLSKFAKREKNNNNNIVIAPVVEPKMDFGTRVINVVKSHGSIKLSDIALEVKSTRGDIISHLIRSNLVQPMENDTWSFVGNK